MSDIFYMNDDEFIEKYKNLAYSIARSFYTARNVYVDRDDVNQMALMYLWQARTYYDKSQKTDFITFANIYIHNQLLDYFRKLNTQKRQGDYNRVNMSGIGDDEEDHIESLKDNYNGENSLSYRLLQLDIEMQLKKMKDRKKNQKKKTALLGIEIIERIMSGEKSDEIMKQMDLDRNRYNYILSITRAELKQEMS